MTVQQSVFIRTAVVSRSISIVAVACAGLSSPAVAISVPAAPAAGAVAGEKASSASSSPEDSGAKLEEVIVTAQKREESIQSVPISAQVVAGQALAEQNYNSLAELTATVPAVHVATGGYSNEMFIRGIGSGNNPSFDESVSTFVDDVYHGRSRMSDATFLDLDRIEVLKGPQSTFFGNNAIAGALNISTRKPGDAFDGWGRALYGQHGQYALEGAVGGPITETFGARLAVTRNGGTGWIDNVNTGRTVPDINNEAARLTFVFKPTADLDVTLKSEAGRHRTSGTAADQPQQWANCPPAAPFPNSFGSPSCAQALAENVPLGLDNDRTAGLAGLGNSLSSFENVLTVNYNVGNDTLTSVSGFYNYHYNQNNDSSLPIPFLNGAAPESYHQFSQEFRVTSPAERTVEYAAGAYFQTDRLDTGVIAVAPFLSFLAAAPGFTALAPYLPLGFEPKSLQDEHVYSLFGSLSWNVTEHLKVSGGLRASRVDKDANLSLHYGQATQTYGGIVSIPPAIEQLWSFVYGAPGAQVLSRSDDAWMPSAQIQYQVNPRAMAYFRYDRGFKSGGSNALFPTNQPADVVFGPEHVNAYEIGLKSKWLDDTVLLNLDVFRSDYQDLQVNAEQLNPAINTYFQVVRNAAASRSQGVELETQWVITGELRLAASATYLDSYYVSFPNASPATLQSYCAQLALAAYSSTPQCAGFPFPVPAVADASGQATQYAPRWSGSVTVSYAVTLPQELKVTAQLNPYFTSSYYTQSADPFRRVDAYVRLDGRLTFERARGRWAVDVIGKNLTDRIIVTNPGLSLESKEEPRNVAVQVRYRW